eukprot:TRINITY_DN4256_c0_g1_i1.p1 TRINITY_DN4256_c0_g1~~TRINITY_DN4256_c0_g1_i1.p1  ORF type:complete len:349 (-),score=57.46 TRINITY_DN4256_c0_g1_i1:431-1477(-)
MDAQKILDALVALDDDSLQTSVILGMMKHKPQLCPAVIAAACPEYTYAPSKAITERRGSGVLKKVNYQNGYGFISCPDLHGVFGCDVFVHSKQIGHIQEGAHVEFAILLNKDNKPQAFDVEDMSGGGGHPAVTPRAQHAGKGGGGYEHAGKGGGGYEHAGKGGGGYDQGGNQQVLGDYYGIIKRFDPVKGFGFIHIEALAAEIAGDIYLHRSNIGDFEVGQRVLCNVYFHNGRAQARDLRDSATPKGSGRGGGQAHEQGSSDQELGRFTGTVKSFNAGRGFGFLTSDTLSQKGHGDCFVHHKNFGDFQPGDQVCFTAYIFNGQLQAKDLQSASDELGAQASAKRSRFS